MTAKMMGLLASMATGALIGALYAPEKGEQNRKNLSKKMDELKEKFGKAVDSVMENLHKMEHQAVKVEKKVQRMKPRKVAKRAVQH